MSTHPVPARRWRRVPTTTLLGAVVALALLGPLLAPHPASVPVAGPYLPPSTRLPLGTDHLGRDVLSRVLHGGVPVVLTSLLAAVIGCLTGTVAGLAAALTGTRSRWLEGTLMRPLDTVAAVPPLLVVLLALTAAPGRLGVVIAIAVVGAPLSARVIRAAAAPVAARPHVEAAIARGERPGWLLGREVLPLVAGTVVADLGLRFVAAVYLVTAAGFLGLAGTGTDWGLLVVEALPAAPLQPVALAAPVTLVVLLAVSVTVLADDLLARSRAVLG